MVGILPLLCLCTSFDFIDNTDQEWIADGHSITHEVIYPFDCVQPLSGHTLTKAAQAFFMGEDGEYRIILVGGDRMIVIDENEDENLEFDLTEYGCCAVYISDSGRYVVTHGEPLGTAVNSELIDIDQGTRSYFSATDSTVCWQPWISVSNSGRVLSQTFDMSTRSNVHAHEISTNTYSDIHTPNGIFEIPLVNEETGEIVFFNQDVNPIVLTGVDSTGSVLWTRQTDYNGMHAPLFVPGTRLFLAPFDGLVTCFSADDGSEIWRSVISDGSEMLTRARYLCVSENGDYWCVQVRNSATGFEETRRPYFYIGQIEGTLNQTVSLTRPMLQNWFGPNPLEIGNNGSVLLKFSASLDNDQEGIRYVIADSEGNPVWASERMELTGPGRLFAFPEGYRKPATLSPDGMRVIYFETGDASAHIVTISGVE